MGEKERRGEIIEGEMMGGNGGRNVDTAAPCRKQSFAYQKSAEFCYSRTKSY